MLGGFAAETEALFPALAGFAGGPLGPRLRLSAQSLELPLEAAHAHHVGVRA